MKIELTTLQQKILDTFRSDIKNRIVLEFDSEYLKCKHDILLTNVPDFNNMSMSKLFDLYVNFRQRFPTGRKQVIYSQELLRNPLFKKFRKSINKISTAFNTGDSIREYLPKGIGDLRHCDMFDNKLDDLMSGWGVAHLHLFTREEREQLELAKSEDDKYVLFIMSDLKSVFFIDIGDHHRFVDSELLNIINNNITGDALVGFVSRNINLKPSNLNTKDQKTLRNKNVGYAININDNGDIFMSGMRRLTNLTNCARIDDQLRAIAIWVGNNYDTILSDIQINHPTGSNIKTLDFHIEFNNECKLDGIKSDDLFLCEKTLTPIVRLQQENPALIMVADILRQIGLV